MQFNVYQGGTLAATFRYGREPQYFGEAGQRIKDQVAKLHYSHRAWTDENAFEWIDQLTDAGYTIYAIYPAEEPPLGKVTIH